MHHTKTLEYKDSRHVCLERTKFCSVVRWLTLEWLDLLDLLHMNFNYLCALVLHLMGSRIEQSGDLVSPKGCLSHKQINIHGITSETCTWLFEWMVGGPASRSSNEGIITVPNSCFLFQFVQKTVLELHGVLVLPFSQYNWHLVIHRCPLSQSVQQSLCYGCLGHLFT